MDNPKQGMISAMRKQTEVLNLKAKEIQDEIIRRSQLEKRWADILTNLTVYNDPEPNIIENINSDEEEEKNDQSSGVGMKLMKRCQYILKISNIDKNLRPKDLNRFFNDCGRKAQRFKGRDGKNFGEGILIGTNTVSKTKDSAILVIKLPAPLFESVKVSGLTIPFKIIIAS